MFHITYLKEPYNNEMVKKTVLELRCLIYTM